MPTPLMVALLAVLILGSVLVYTRTDAPANIPNTETDTMATDAVTEMSPDAAPATDTTPPPPPPSSRTINLRGQNLTAVPAYVFGQTSTESLNLSNNKLTGALPGEVRHLSSLRSLDLSENQFTGVPAEVGQLTLLETLDLSNNKLTGLPYELGNLKNLKTLDLRGNDYATADLEVIKRGLPATTQILVD